MKKKLESIAGRVLNPHGKYSYSELQDLAGHVLSLSKNRTLLGIAGRVLNHRSKYNYDEVQQLAGFVLN